MPFYTAKNSPSYITFSLSEGDLSEASGTYYLAPGEAVAFQYCVMPQYNADTEDIVGTMTTDGDDIASYSNLPLGTYYVKNAGTRRLFNYGDGSDRGDPDRRQARI